MFPQARYIGRLAPAPTGALHLGNARTFLIAWLRARQAGGKLLLRLENLDHPKVKPTAARDAYLDLEWLGLDWDFGPRNSFPPHNKTPHPDDPFIQSNRHARYREIIHALRDAGRIYLCACTRKDLESHQSAPNAGEDMLENRYPGLCRGRYTDEDTARNATGREPAWRFRVDDGKRLSFTDNFHGPQNAVLSQWSGDFLIARGGQAGYQLAVVIDDHDMNVTEVVRGDDLLPSTQRQLALYEALSWDPPEFFHIPLVVGPDGRRLAKRHGDTRLSVLRESGSGPERVLGWLAWSCGWQDKAKEITLAEIAKKCDCTVLPRERIVLTPDAMHWLGF